MQELKEYLFEICTENRTKYIYVEAYVKVEKIIDLDSYIISDVEWAYTKLDYHMDEQDVEDSLRELDVEGIEKEGYYVLKGLFSVEYDSDDYRTWSYLGDTEIIEYTFCSTIEEGEKNNTIVDNLGMNYDLF